MLLGMVLLFLAGCMYIAIAINVKREINKNECNDETTHKFYKLSEKNGVVTCSCCGKNIGAETSIHHIQLDDIKVNLCDFCYADVKAIMKNKPPFLEDEYHKFFTMNDKTFNMMKHIYNSRKYYKPTSEKQKKQLVERVLDNEKEIDE